MLRGSIALIAATALATTGCGTDSAPREPAKSPGSHGRQQAKVKPEPKAEPLRRARCAPGVANCVAVTGRVIYVEAVDPDGDGDAHYVLAGGSVTAPGLSAIDVAAELRPRRLPRLGDLVSAAGPVMTGSHGQHQVEATVVHHQRR